jgi:hypothetical protein
MSSNIDFTLVMTVFIYKYYSRTLLALINWEEETTEYGENLDKWIFLSK